MPQFGLNGIIGDGETKAEALESLDIIKKYIFKLHLKEDIIIPEPESNLK